MHGNGSSKLAIFGLGGQPRQQAGLALLRRRLITGQDARVFAVDHHKAAAQRNTVRAQLILEHGQVPFRSAGGRNRLRLLARIGSDVLCKFQHCAGRVLAELPGRL